MRILEDYHTHTKFSHGVGTIEENVEFAIRKKLKTIAITDHGPAFWDYGINISDFDKMKEKVNFLREKYKRKIDILLGMEANIIDKHGSLDIDEKILNHIDILLVGFHFDISYKNFLKDIRKNINKRDNIKNYVSKEIMSEIEFTNTQAMVETIKSYNVDIITHINDKFSVDVLEVAKACSRYKTAIEINNFHRNPSIKDISKILDVKDIKFSVGSDAHRPKDVGNFNIALKKMKSCKLEDKIINKIKLE
ncbi:PHP domain-containing protein [Clostridium massiliodielmoense]|uniref:PHP domain-containing protein n=1 Tax=Clostridium massiliodielmoense TaxID=1776385 RepID=UPI0004D410A2|nr:PHP domain-containing protein [Clostridium massiliodielmoense]KEH92460.1 DNA polymerase III subunit beta [Clostridium botulinum C/D str. BKT12695]